MAQQMEFHKRWKGIIWNTTRRKEKKKDNSYYQFHKVNFTFLSNWITFTQS